LIPNADGTFTVEGYGFIYAPRTPTGGRVVNDQTDSETIVLWDPHPLSNGEYFAITASLAGYGVRARDIASRRIEWRSVGGKIGMP
jgi:alpha/beta superfamily hydrolase